LNKQEVARRQLGVALHMFLREEDPVAIHCLALGGGEIAEVLADIAGGTTVVNTLLQEQPEASLARIYSEKNKFWNAFKHGRHKNGKVREDEELLRGFDPSHNEDMLYFGWYDYARAGLPRPIEAQVFEVWLLAKHPDKISPDADTPSDAQNLSRTSHALSHSAAKSPERCDQKMPQKRDNHARSGHRPAPAGSALGLASQSITIARCVST
jgi:hypothetical protein